MTDRLHLGDAVMAEVTAESTKSASVGETVLVWGNTRYSGEPGIHEVTKVGRKWLTCKRLGSGWREAQFAIESGRPQYEFSQGERAYGKTDWEVMKLSRDASETIRAAGLEIRFGGVWDDASKVRLAEWLKKEIL